MTDSTWQEIPETVMAELEKLMNQLPHPSSQVTEIKEAILRHLQEWEADQNANHLVILGSPVSNLEPLVAASFPRQQLKEVEVIYPLSRLNIHQNPSQITQQLKSVIEEVTQKSNSSFLAPSQQSKTKIIMIPSLEQCFLRCIGGWDGIIWLREHIVSTPHCFWVLGCNDWSWLFLDYVCQINSYLGTKINVPLLNADHLQEWLQPFVESFIPEEKANSSSFFWQTLATLSEGKSTIAMSLWLQSIRMSVDEKSAEETEDWECLKLVTPSLPKLRPLSAEDRYLLHSLLLHHTMTRTSLALSLGEKEEKIQGRMQLLLRDNLLQLQAGWFRVAPLHYPKIKQELNQNNFLVGEAE